jgi:cytochrome c oxidase cbb3-type subunit III
MQRQQQLALAALFGFTITAASHLVAQAPAPDAPQAPPAAAGRGGGRGGGRGRGAAGATGAAAASGAVGRGGGGGAYPSRPPADPVVAARGKAIWDASCAKCHAADMRGAPGGINLVRNQLVMDDQNGELIGKVLQNPHAKGQAPKMDLAADQVHDLSIYMHTFMNYRTIVVPPDINGAILALGSAKAGEAYFNGAVGKCSTCHSVTGDLKGIGSKYPEPRTLQNTIVSGGGGGGRGGGRGGGGAAAGDTPRPGAR